MIDRNLPISISHQCRLLEIHRSGLYYKPRKESEENLLLMRLMDEQYLHTPFYGIRRMKHWLWGQGYKVNYKRVRCLMEIMGWETLYRKPNLSKPDKGHHLYPYLLKGMEITHANQVWAIDITYIPMRRGFMYLCALIDLHTRYVVNWSISNTMTTEWIRGIVEEAITVHGKPTIINSDQGSQFTSDEYTSLFDQQMKISMDGKGRAIDNIFIERLWRSVKYECVYLHAFEDGLKLYEGLKSYFHFYNQKRLHQSLGYKTPAMLYTKAA
jgi:putative transposase